MAEPDRSAKDETEVIPQVETGEGTSNTLELPAVPATGPAPLNPKVNVPRPVGQEPTGPIYDQMYDRPPAYPQAPAEQPGGEQQLYQEAPPAHQQPSYQQPVQQAPYEQPAAGYPTAPPTAAPPAAAPPAAPVPPRRRTSIASRQILTILAGAVVVVLIAVAVILGLRGHSGSTPKVGTPKSAVAVAPLSPTVSSFAVSGTGFRKDGSGWVTQTYSTPEFGGLKAGVGLVLDLGSAKSVSGVSFDAGTGPLQVELRSADSRAGSISGWTKVSANSSASGSVTLSGSSGGKHQYWLIWVTRLGSDNRAEITGISVKGAS